MTKSTNVFQYFDVLFYRISSNFMDEQHRMCEDNPPKTRKNVHFNIFIL